MYKLQPRLLSSIAVKSHGLIHVSTPLEGCVQTS